MSCIHCEKKIYSRGVCQSHYQILLLEVVSGRSSWFRLVKSGKALSTKPKVGVKIYEYKPILISEFESISDAARSLGAADKNIRNSMSRGDYFHANGKIYKAKRISK